jgi:hypothetical protein
MKTLVTFLATVLFNKSLKKDIMPISKNPSGGITYFYANIGLKKWQYIAIKQLING